jgi:hypothetical protein
VETWSREALSPKQLLLKGSRLQSTEFVFGLAMYVGRDTKVRKKLFVLQGFSVAHQFF